MKILIKQRWTNYTVEKAFSIAVKNSVITDCPAEAAKAMKKGFPVVAIKYRGEIELIPNTKTKTK